MLTFGPYKYDDDYRHGVWQGTDLPEICANGLDNVYPDLPRQNLYEFRLYAQRPRGEATQVDVEFNSRRLDIAIYVLDEDEEVIEDVNIPDDLHDALFKELGLDWDDIVDRDCYESAAPEYENTYTAWLRVVDLGPPPFEIYDVEVENVLVEDKTAKLLIYASNGGYARVEVDLSSAEWEFD